MRNILIALFAATSVPWKWLRRTYWRFRFAEFGDDANVSKAVTIYQASKMRVGARCRINEFVHIWAGGGVEIGDDTLIAAHVTITSVTHDSAAGAQGLLYSETRIASPVVIGRNVWIGSGAVILPGVTIGDHSIVAAGAVVNSNVSPKSLVAGVPARKIKDLMIAL